ncbi:MAG: hypothetical protein AMXMBFR53_05090 [Gemmatimonadota bacterium]
MEQLIFVGIIVLFSILEAVARKGKERQGGGGDLPVPEEEARPAPRPRSAPETRSRPAPASSGPPAYDHDASYDDKVEGRPTRPRPTSEGLIPAEVWDEIQRMARGEAPVEAPPPPPPPRPRPPPAKPSPRPGGAPPARRTPPKPAPARGVPTARRVPAEVSRPVPAGKPETVDAGALEGSPDHAVHLSHAAYGTPVAGRLTGFAPEASGRRASREAGAARELLRGGPARLRQAVILQELLGPPLALRDEGSRPE